MKLRSREADVAKKASENLTERDLLAFALVALANNERVVVLAMLADRSASPAVVQVLLDNADTFAEAARNEGGSDITERARRR